MTGDAAESALLVNFRSCKANTSLWRCDVRVFLTFATSLAPSCCMCQRPTRRCQTTQVRIAYEITSGGAARGPPVRDGEVSYYSPYFNRNRGFYAFKYVGE